MRACEIKGLLWRDVNWLDRIISVRFSKTEAGIREIPVNGAACNVLRELHERAKVLGTDSPDSPVFAVGLGRPVKSWRSAWKSLTAAAGITGFRFHDCRHHAISELAESQASDMTVMEIAGHVDHDMLRHYSHIRMEAKRRALEALDRSTPAVEPTQQEKPPASEQKPV